MFDSIAIDQAIVFDVTTNSPTTGAATDADSTPTYSVFEDSNDTAILSAQNFTKRTSLTGDYRGSFTASAANGFEVGKCYNVIASATVGAIAGKAVPMRFRCVPAENVAGAPIVDTKYVAGTSQTAGDIMADTNDIQTRLPAALTGAGNIKAEALVVSDKTGFALSSAGVQAIWDALASALTTVGSIGEYITSKLNYLAIKVGIIDGRVDMAISAADDAALAQIALVKAKTDLIPASPAAVGSEMTLTSGERTLIANEVEAQIIDETDSEKVLQAMTDKIASVNPDLGGLSVGAIASASATSVWGAATRRLTDGTNIVLAKGVGVTGLNDLDAAGVRGAVGLATGNLDTQLDAIPTNTELATALAAADDAVLAAVAALNNLSSAQVATALAAYAATAVDGTATRDTLLKVAAAGAGGTREGFGTGSVRIKSLSGLVDRISSDDPDGQGNATIVIDPS